MSLKYAPLKLSWALALSLSLSAAGPSPSLAQTPRPTPDSERSAPGNERPQPQPAPKGGQGPNQGQKQSPAPDQPVGPKAATPSEPGFREPGPDGKAAPPAKGKAAAPKGPPPIAVQQPRTPAEREKALSDLYALLATSDDAPKAKSVSANIERLWLNSGSDTVAVLMDRAIQAQQAKNPTLALKLLDSVVDLAPDYAEGWNRRAYVHFAENNVERALGDLRRVLALDPNHFKALDGLAHILKDVGQKKAALAAVRKLLEVHPYWEGAQTMHDELAREVEGQAL
jgi:tetratricopeptide (TPR) repeat protein